MVGCAETGGKPNCAAWEFDSGTVEGWVVDPNAGGASSRNASAAPLAASSVEHISGPFSLAVPWSGDGVTTNEILVKVKLCGAGEAVNVIGKTVSARIHFDPAPPTANQDHSLILFTDASLTFSTSRLVTEFIVDSTSGGAPGNPWLPFSFQIDSLDTMVTGIGILFLVGDPYVGTIFIDNVSMQ
jgi:hypothetical protein